MEERQIRINGEPCALKGASTVRRGGHVPAQVGWPVLTLRLGAILLKFTINAPIAEGDNYNGVLLIVINLFIGLSLLFIPFTTRAFLKGDFSGYTAGLSMAPALAGKAVVLKSMKKAGGFAVAKSRSGFSYGMKATRNTIRKASFRQSQSSSQNTDYSNSNYQTRNQNNNNKPFNKRRS